MYKRVGKCERFLVTFTWVLLILNSACAGTTPESDPVYPTEEARVETEYIEVTEIKIEQDPITNGESDLVPVIPDTTKAFSWEEAPEILSSMEVRESIIFLSEASLLEAGITDPISEIGIESGDVLMIDPIEGAPNGLLRKITNIETDQSGNLLIQTDFASLVDAIHTGEVHEQYEGETIAFNEPTQGGHLAKVVQAPLGEFTISPLLDGVDMTGSVRIKPSFDFDIIIKDRQLQLLRFVNTTKMTGTIKVKTKIIEEKYKEEVELKRVTLSPYKVPVIGTKLNIWLTPTLIIKVGAEGKIIVDISTEVKQDFTFNTGVFYPDEQGKYKLIFEPSLGQFEYIPPEVRDKFTLRAYVRPELLLKVFEFVGPYAGIDGYIEFDAGLSRSPLWELYAGLRGSVGVRIEIFTLAIAGWDSELFNEKWPIAAAEPVAQGQEPAVEPAKTLTPTNTKTPTIEMPTITREPTNTANPTITKKPTATPSRTTSPPDGTSNIMMIYDDIAATLINISNHSISVVGVEFKQITNDGFTTAEFATELWEPYSQVPISALPPGDCFAVSTGNFTRPSECDDIWGWYTTSQFKYHFWKPRPGPEFQVFKNGNPIHTCTIADGTCAFYLPQP